MASFDLKFLFLDLTLGETFAICLELLFYRKGIVQGMLKEYLSHAVKFSTFVFNNIYYNVNDKQFEAIAMGSSLGTTLANLVLECYESK